MTDNEIIKALECCGSEKGNLCTLCPKFKKLGDNCIETDLFNDALNLINRQKAEIERLQKEQNRFADIGKMYSEIKSEARKEFAERLKSKSYISSDWVKVVNTDYIDNLVKEMESDLNG